MCNKDTEIDILRSTLQDYRKLLVHSYEMLRSPESVTQEKLEDYITKLKELGLDDPVEGAWNDDNNGKGVC